jgi:hypothetical protein
LGFAEADTLADGDPLILGDIHNNLAKEATHLHVSRKLDGSPPLPSPTTSFEVKTNAGTAIQGTVSLTEPSSLGVGVAGWGQTGVFGHSTGPTKLGSGKKAAHFMTAGVIGAADDHDPGQFVDETFRDASVGVYGGGATGVQGVASPSKGKVQNIGVHAVGVQGGIALFADGGRPGVAAMFRGFTAVRGNFVVTGDKCSAVAQPDGSHRLLYCVESPESWFEDFGRARLARGRAVVKLEPLFGASVKLDDYHVFLTPEGPTAGLYVHRRTSTAFEVREQGAGPGNASFSFRIVARRKDSTGTRLQRVALPAERPVAVVRSGRGRARTR